jgi:hypothetical protein
MVFTKEQRIELIKIYYETGKNLSECSRIYHQRHLAVNAPSRNAIRNLVAKFDETGNVANRKRPGRVRPVTGPDPETDMLAAVIVKPNVSTSTLSNDCGMSRTSVARILKRHHFHPYKLQVLQTLNEGDYHRREEFCLWAQEMINDDAAFTRNVLFSDECLFYLNGEVNKQNFRYWSQDNPNWMEATRAQNDPRVMVWAGILDTTIIGPYFFDDTVTGESYKFMLENFLVPWLEDLPLQQFVNVWFQQDGASAHFALDVRHFLDVQFPRQWIGRGGGVEWPPRSPDLTPLDFYLWGYAKSYVYENRPRPQDLDELKNRIRDSFATIQLETLRKVQRNFRKRLEWCLDAEGKHFEHVIS